MWVYLATGFLLLVAVGHGAPVVPDITTALVQSTRCTPTSTSTACLAYERCKSTHRCARGHEEYSIAQAKLEAFDQTYAQGSREQIPLVNDFEDWKTGVHHWTVPLDWKAPVQFNLDTFALPILGSLELTAGTIYIDTTAAVISGDVSFQGLLLQTPHRTVVAVFNFLTLRL
ncbi:hypothetical protein AaE_002451, partial [Aphanomyces astaci]